MYILKEIIRKLCKNDLERKFYYKKDEDVIQRRCTDKIGRTYCVTPIEWLNKKE